jgi:hypothetical protein
MLEADSCVSGYHLLNYYYFFKIQIFSCAHANAFLQYMESEFLKLKKKNEGYPHFVEVIDNSVFFPICRYPQ